MLNIDQQAHLRNLTIVSGGGGTVGPGGYLTGAGHAALSSTYGLGADQVLEMEIVTPGGDVITINECQHTELFWAMRGVSNTFFQCKCSNTALGRRLYFRCHNLSDDQSISFIRLPCCHRIPWHKNRNRYLL